MPDPPPDSSEVYADYIKLEVDRQSTRKASFEQRGVSVITSAGVLVTLLFGLAALSTRQQATFTLPTASKVLVVVALVFFVLAIGFALAVNAPRAYENVTADALSGVVKTRWQDPPSAGRQTVANTRIVVLQSAQKVNTGKARLLFWAFLSEFIAVVLLAAAVAVVIATPSAPPAAPPAAAVPQTAPALVPAPANRQPRSRVPLFGSPGSTPVPAPRHGNFGQHVH